MVKIRRKKKLCTTHFTCKIFYTKVCLLQQEKKSPLFPRSWSHLDWEFSLQRFRIILICLLFDYRISIRIQQILIFYNIPVKVRFTQKMLVKLSHHHLSEPFFAPGLLFPVYGINSSDKMSIFSFFCINQINLLKLIQICIHVIINNFIALQAL